MREPNGNFYRGGWVKNKKGGRGVYLNVKDQKAQLGIWKAGTMDQLLKEMVPPELDMALLKKLTEELVKEHSLKNQVLISLEGKDEEMKEEEKHVHKHDHGDKCCSGHGKEKDLEMKQEEKQDKHEHNHGDKCCSGHGEGKGNHHDHGH